MSKSRIFKFIISILIVITLFGILTQCSFASFVGDISNKFDGKNDKSNATNTVSVIIGKTINATQVVGAGIAILMLVILGIRWIGSSPSGKAQIAKEARYYILGAILIFAAIGLLQIIKTFTKGSFRKYIKKYINF